MEPPVELLVELPDGSALDRLLDVLLEDDVVLVLELLASFEYMSSLFPAPQY